MTLIATIVTVAVAVLGGGGIAVAIVGARNERWKFHAERAAAKEDKAEERADQTAEIADENRRQEQRLDNLERQMEAVIKGQRAIMLDRIIYLGQSYIKRGSVSYEERSRLRAMHSVYHNDLGGNGDADWIMAAVDALPLER